MKKIIALFVILLVAASALIAPVAAAPTAELNTLASYFPADTAFLVSLRTDDAYIQEIDDLFAKIAAQIPGMEKPESIADQLDKAIGEGLGDGDFDSEVRSWLGDVASIGIMSFEGLMGRADSAEEEPPPHFLLAAQLKDKAAAEAFWETALAKVSTTTYEKTTEGDFVIFKSDNTERGPGIVAIGNDVLFIAVYEEDLPLEGQESPLSENAIFTDSLALLPEPDYNITLYFNLADVFKQAMATLSDQSGMADAQAAMMENYLPLFENFPPEVIGFTVLDERSLTIDVALPYGQIMSDLSAAGMNTAMPVAVDPAFAANILTGSPLVIHSTNLGASILNGINNLKTQADMMQSSEFQSADIEKGIGQVGALIKILTGKDLETEILPAMEGDYALYLTLSPALSDLSSQADVMKQLPVDFGFLTEMTDPTIGPAIAEGITKSLNESEELELSTETIGGIEALVITPIQTGAPFPVELILASSDNLLFFGTRRAAEAALEGSGGFDSDAAFAEAGQYFVSSPSIVAYFGSEGLKPLVDVMELMGSSRDSAQLAAFLNLVSSASITSNYDQETGLARIVLTLSE
ncbi:MAG: DUF3352 domain-containing protein [Anaerolineae bacterium]|nr:DUF3352 domain-containing protein [Anaerolineae bacterium]